MSDFSFNKFRSNKRKKYGNSNHEYEKDYEKTDIFRPAFSIFHLPLGDYLYAITETSLFFIKKCKHC